jgi:hypothetical protein
MAYVAWDAIMSPLHKSAEARVDAVRTKLYPEIRFAISSLALLTSRRGCHTMWLSPVSAAALASVLGGPPRAWNPLAVLPPTIAFVAVKGLQKFCVPCASASYSTR